MRRETDSAVEPKSAQASVASGSALLFVAQIVANTGFFVAVLILARGLPPAGRGIVAFVTVLAVVTASVTALGAGQSATVIAARYPERRSALLTNLVCFVFVSGAIGGGIVAGVLALLPSIRPAGLTGWILIALASSTAVASVADSGYGFLLGCGRIRAQAALTALTPWIYAALLAIGWRTSGLTVGRAVAIWLVWQGIWALALVVTSARGIGFGHPSSSLLRELISLGSRLWLGTLSRFLNFRLDQVLMGFLASEAALGIYAIAVNASEVVLYLPGAVATAMLPVIARAETEDQAEKTLAIFRGLTLIVAPTVVIAAILGPPLVPLIFGGSYRGSIGPYLVLLFGAFGYAASGVFSSALAGSSRPARASLGPLVSLVLGFILDLTLIPPFAATGAAIAASVAYIAGGVVALMAYLVTTGVPARELLPKRQDTAMARAVVSAFFGRLRRSSG